MIRQLFLLITALSTIPLCLSGQEQERIFNTDTFNHTSGVTYLDSAIYILDNRGSFFNAGVKRLWLYKLDMNLKTRDSVLIDNFISSSPGLSHRLHTISISDQELMLSIVLDSLGNRKVIRESFILFLDKNLRLQRQFQVTDDSLDTQVMAVTQSQDSLTVIGFKQSQVTDKRYPFLDILDSSGQILINKTYLDTNFDFPGPDTTLLRQDKMMTSLTERGDYFFASLNVRRLSNGLDVLAVLDSNYNIIETCHLRDAAQLKETYMPGDLILNRQKELVSFSLSTRQRFPPQNGSINYYNIEICRILPGQFCPVSCDTLPFSGFEGGNNGFFSLPQLTPDYLDYISTDSVFFAVTGKFLNANALSFLEQDSTVLYLYNYNANQGKLNWRREIVPGNNLYWNTSVTVLPGNRYLMAFNEQRWKVPHDNLRTHIMIFNGKGEVINEREFKAPEPAWSVYPNPLSTNFTLEGLPENEPLQLQLLNINGQIVWQQEGKTRQWQLPSTIEKGVYLLKLTNAQGQPLGLRKVVVQGD